MAKAPIRARKRVRKQVSDGVAHIHASFNNTIVTITDRQVTHWVGQQPVVPVSVVLANPLRSQLRLQQSVAQKP